MNGRNPEKGKRDRGLSTASGIRAAGSTRRGSGFTRGVLLRRPARHRAFTLIEALMALSLTGLLAAGCVTLLMETARARAELETAPIFTRHVRGLGGFLETAVARTTATANPAGLFSAPPGSPPGTPPALHLQLSDMTVLPVAGETRPEGDGWLTMEKDAGLVLYWRTALAAKTDAATVKRTVLSPFVTDMTPLEYDPARDLWGTVDPSRPAGLIGMKRRALLRLRRFGETAEIVLNLDAPPAFAPAY